MSGPNATAGSPGAAGPDELRMSGANARIIIINAHALLRNKYRGIRLWSMVGSLTGHGSGYSAEICRSANLDPMQPCGARQLRDLPESPKAHDSATGGEVAQ